MPNRTTIRFGKQSLPGILSLVLVVLAASSSLVHAQGTITLQGVYIDAGKVLRTRQVTPKTPFRPDVREGQSVCYVSLPRMFAELRRRVEANEPIPESLLYLDGMVKLQSVHVDVERHDLIIAGQAETWDAGDVQRPRGKRTGRPALRLDDLVVALRSMGPDSRIREFGCTLEQSPNAVDRVRDLQTRLARSRSASGAQVAAALKEAIGPLDAKFFGVPDDSRVALVCVECDYLMKRLSLGLDRAPVTGLQSYLSLSSGTSLFNRFWFTVKYDPLLVSEDGQRIEIRGQGLQVLASNSPTSNDVQNPAAKKFADDFTASFPKLEEAIPAFADLHNVADLAVLAALITEDRLYEQAGWDPAWILKPDGYRPAPVVVPKQAETLVNASTKGRRTVTCAGGVHVAPQSVLKTRQSVRGEATPVSGTTSTESQRPRQIIPPENWSARVRPAGNAR